MNASEPLCAACAAALTPGARFCHRCGRPTGSRATGAPWAVAWTIIVVLIGAILYYVYAGSSGQGAQPAMANVGSARGQPEAPPAGGRPPDISQLSPQDRFLRLHDRVMAAAQAGDTATVTRFSPMAVAAYGLLDSVDSDLRYHAASLRVVTGDLAGASALADTILARAPDHLFGWIIRADVARARRDEAAFDRARRAYLGAYDAELRTGRLEYREHLGLLEQRRDEFRKP